MKKFSLFLVLIVICADDGWAQGIGRVNITTRSPAQPNTTRSSQNITAQANTTVTVTTSAQPNTTRLNSNLTNPAQGNTTQKSATTVLPALTTKGKENQMDDQRNQKNQTECPMAMVTKCLIPTDYKSALVRPSNFSLESSLTFPKKK
jgi:hypothetical protein